LGEVVIIQDPEAAVISFNCFFPAQPFLGVQFDKLTAPYALIERIEKWKNSGKPVKWTLTGTPLNDFFSIEDFKYNEQDLGDIHYSITLKKFTDVKVRQVSVNVQTQRAVAPAPTPPRVDNRVTEKTHTVVRGDTLWGISARYLGNGARFNEIFELNRNIISNPNLIHIGWVLRIPQ
jgi:nucleoid-associated protein YgaU